MKKQFNHLKLLLPALLILSSLNTYAQEFTLTTTTANTSSSKALIDLPGLTGNGNAIIIATPEGSLSNQHPTGAWYYQGKWNLFNSDHAALAMGLTYKVTYFLNPGPNQFVHVMSKQNIGTEGSYIDHTTLNNNPNAQFTIFQNHAPEIRPGALNMFATKTGYSTAAGKWYITNTGNEPLMKGSAYNIVISERGSASYKAVGIDELVIKPTQGNGIKSIAPNGNAGGDLSGTYPDPTVQKLLGRPLSITAPGTGQVLKWNGTAWEAANDEVSSGSTPAASGWTVNRNTNTLNNTNTGNVGIGNSNPAYLLDVNGRMRIRSSGSRAGSAGVWLNNDANTETSFIGMEDDDHVGFFGVVGGWKFGMNTNTGALKINGSEGQPSQVLVSNGAAAPGYKTIGNVIRTEIKNGSGSIEALVMATVYHLPQLTHSITLTTKSRIIISANVSLWTGFCVICGLANINLLLKVNNSLVLTLPYSVSNDNYTSASICNYIVELNAGTHSIDFYSHYTNGPNHVIYPKHSSIIIIPVD